MNEIRISKFLSLVLRHDPGRIGVVLDASGWVGVQDLLDAMAAHGSPLDRDDLERIVAVDSKQRYTLDADRDRIRANQGHSVSVDLGLVPVMPPPVLFHGTPNRNVPAILRDGLRRGNRHHVHLSADTDTAAAVGARRGACTLLRVDAAAMHADGYPFCVSANGVWLADAVPARYLDRADRHSQPGRDRNPC